MYFPFKKQIVGLLNDGESKSVSPTETKGAPGFTNHNGFIVEKEINPNLAGRQKYITYSNILANTAIVAAGVRYFLNLLARATWTVAPADESTAAEEHAELVEKIINDMNTPWSRVVRRAGMFKFYGHSVQEWTAKMKEDGVIGLLDIEPRPSHTIERWDTNEQGNVMGIVQRSPQTQKEIYLPREKIVYVVDDSLTDSPEGIGIFRHIVQTATDLARYEQLEGFGFEMDLRGIPVGRAPLVELAEKVENGTLNQKQADAIMKPLKNFVSNAIKNPKLGMLLDSSVYRSEDTRANPSSGAPQWGIELLQGSNTSQEQVARAIERKNHEIARLIGVEHLLLGGDGRGTQALSRDKSHNFFLIIDSTLTELSETFEKDIIDTIWKLNGFNEDLKPKFSTEAAQFRDIEQISQVIKDLADAGDPLMPDDPIINEVRELIGVSAKDMDQVIMDLGLNNGRQRTSTPTNNATDEDDVRNLGDQDEQ